MTENRKEWVKPELIILVRSKPEEAVLNVCKAGTGGAWSVCAWNHCGPGIVS